MVLLSPVFCLKIKRCGLSCQNKLNLYSVAHLKIFAWYTFIYTFKKRYLHYILSFITTISLPAPYLKILFFLIQSIFFFQFLYYLWVHLYFYRQWWIHLYYLWTSNQIIMMDFMLHRNRQIGYSDSLMAHFISASQYIQNYQLLNYCCWLIQVPTIDQGNGIYGTEPTETLLTFRSDEVLRPSHKNKRQVIVSCSSFHLFRSIEICVWPCKFLLHILLLRTEHFIQFFWVYFCHNLVCKESLSGNNKGKIVKVGNPVYVVHSLLLMKPQPESGLFNFPCAIDYSSI